MVAKYWKIIMDQSDTRLCLGFGEIALIAKTLGVAITILHGTRDSTAISCDYAATLGVGEDVTTGAGCEAWIEGWAIRLIFGQGAEQKQECLWNILFRGGHYQHGA